MGLKFYKNWQGSNGIYKNSRIRVYEEVSWHSVPIFVIKNGIFLDLWGHYLKPACSKERVRERSMSTLNNILHRFHYFFRLLWSIGSHLTHFPDSVQLGFYVTNLHDISKLTTFLFLRRFAWFFNSIILTVCVSKVYNKQISKTGVQIFASSNTLSKFKEARDGLAG